MTSKLITISTLVLALSFFTFGACAQLVPTSFGFPTIVQTSNALAWSQDTANALDYQNVNIDFSGAGVPFSAGVGFSFPSISQTSLQTQSVTHTDFSQSSQFAEFAYPFVGVGATGLPLSGFGF